MRTCGVFIAALAVATLGCKGKPKNLGPTREVQAHGPPVRVAGPFELEATDTIYTGFMTIENLSNWDPVTASVDGCSVVSLKPGERRGCYSYPRPDSTTRIDTMPPDPRVSLKLSEVSLERAGAGRARFTAFVTNDNRDRVVGVQVRFDVVDEENRLVGASDSGPVKSRLAPGESSVVRGSALLAKGAKGKLSPYGLVADGRVEKKSESKPSATLTDLRLQSSTKRKKVAAVITNTSAVAIRPQVWFFLKDAKDRAVGGELCTDTVRDVAPVPLAPGESTPCTATWSEELPPYDRVEVEASPASEMWGTPVTLTPLEVKEVTVERGFIRVAVEKPAPKMAFYIRAKPDWLHIDYANDKTPYEYRLDGATSAEVTAFAVGGPPNENWIPLRQFGKSD